MPDNADFKPDSITPRYGIANQAAVVLSYYRACQSETTREPVNQRCKTNMDHYGMESAT
jgi:hypothetical protein